jgi:hypothetical protein
MMARIVIVAFAIALAGCVAPPQQPVKLSDGFLGAPNTKIGVVMTPLPKVDTYEIGAGCLLCLATVAVANASLTEHIVTLPAENIPELKSEVGRLLEKRGFQVTVIPESIDITKLPSNKSKGVNASTKDFTALKSKYNVDKLLVIEIHMLGTFRTYANYVPTSDPKGTLKGVGYIVDLSNNSYDWYLPVDILKSVEGWDEPPKFPGLTNAYFQALETGRQSFLKPFADNRQAENKQAQ